MSTDIQKWADKAMYDAAPMERDERGNVTPKVHLLWATSDPLGAIAAACRMYEGVPTYDLASVSDEDRRHYWEQVKLTHLKAPLEFVKFHFFIEGVTRAFTHQMVRQRTAVYAQESLRFAVKENMADECAMPPSVQADSAGDRQAVWKQAIGKIEESYNYLIDTGVPAEDARGLLPHAVTTRLNYCTDLRALLDHAGNRLCTQAQFEWRIVFSQIVKSIREFDPPWHTKWKNGGPYDFSWQFQLMADDGVFKPVCYQLGRCPFTADFDRGCTIRDRVQRNEFDKIDDREWLLDPTAGRVK